MAKIPFLERIQDEKPLLSDGAMGTMLHEHGIKIDACFDELNLTQPQIVAEVHREFIDAGAEMIETNTFGANRYKLAKYGLAGRVVEINRAAVNLARRVIDATFRDDIYIAGSVGPLGVRLKPYGRVKPEEARAAFSEQIGALTQAGVDVVLLETFTDRHEILEALAAVRDVAPGTPVICHTTYSRDDRTLMGDLPAKVARELADAGADVIGVNCGGGPAQISRVLQSMRQAAPNIIISAMPNAGYPESIDGRIMYPATAEYFGDYALTFKAIGASIIGGCCGTTPRHIAAMREALDDPSRPLPQIHIPHYHHDDAEIVPEQPTDLSRKLAAGEFVVSVEVAPPRSFAPQKMIAAAQLLQEAGADVINVADSPTARMRMSPWAVCHFLHDHVGIETVLHFPTRGRNLLRVQGDLLAAHALGLRNLFVVMGDPTHIGDYPEAMDNYDVSPSGLIGIIKHQMNTGSDQAGHSIGQPTSFTVGCALNMGAKNIDREITVLRRKIDAGADFALSQAIYDPATIDHFYAYYEQVVGEPFTLPVLLGVIPLYSTRHARFLHNEVPGIHISDEIFKRIETAGDDAPQEGVRIAQELLFAVQDKVQGAYIIPPFGHYELAADIIDAIKINARQPM